GSLVRVDDRVLREGDVAEVARDVEVLAHRAPDDDHLPAALDGDVRRLLHAVDVRREGGDEDLPAAEGEDRAERLAHEPLRPRMARALGVGRVAEQEVDAAVSNRREGSDVGLEPVDRRVIELPVARVHDPAGIALYDQRRRVRDRVRDPHELDAEWPELEGRVCGLGGDELGLLAEAVLVELRLHERERERCRDDLVHVDLPQEIWEAAHMVLVAVREEDRADAPSCEVADVREEEVDAEMLVARKCETCVDDEDLAAELVHGHVLADLAEAAERDDAQAFAHSTEST